MNIEEKIKELKMQLDLTCNANNILSEGVMLISQNLDELIAIEQRNRLEKLSLKK